MTAIEPGRPRAPATFKTKSGRVLLKPPGGGSINRAELRKAIREAKAEREKGASDGVAIAQG